MSNWREPEWGPDARERLDLLGIGPVEPGLLDRDSPFLSTVTRELITVLDVAEHYYSHPRTRAGLCYLFNTVGDASDRVRAELHQRSEASGDPDMQYDGVAYCRRDRRARWLAQILSELTWITAAAEVFDNEPRHLDGKVLAFSPSNGLHPKSEVLRCWFEDLPALDLASDDY